MKRALAVLLCASLPMLALAEDNSYKVMYDGGSVLGVKAGTGVKLYIEANQIRFAKDKKDIAVIPASAVTEISYGQDVHRRSAQGRALPPAARRRRRANPAEAYLPCR